MRNIKKENKVIMLIFTILVLLLIIFVFRPSENKSNKYSDINQVALVYRYTNYSWGKTDYLYILTEDGNVYYENLMENAEKYDDLGEDSLALVLSIFGDTSKIKYQSESFMNEFKDELYSIDYDTVSLESESSAIIDGGDRYYYCLVLSQSEYRLVKICQKGYRIYVPTNAKLMEICEYIDNNIKKS
ncbi:MAG: hypothetical protein K2M78_10350 [Lachnospiraceae bacterium]|nr:hypothetical protein [Lachnospiraceae bacterium]